MEKLEYIQSKWHHYYLYIPAIAGFFYGILLTLAGNRGGIIILVTAAIVYFSAELLRKTTILTIDDNTVTYEFGVLHKKSTSTRLKHISDISTKRNILQRIIGIGDLYINTSGSDKVEIIALGFSKANKIQELIKYKIHNTKREKK